MNTINYLLSFFWPESKQKVTLKIFPSSKFKLTSIKDRPDAQGLMLSTLEGFDFKNCQIDMVDSKHNDLKIGDFTFNNKSYTPEQLNDALLNGEIKHCPSFYIRKLRYLNPNTEFQIMKYENDKFININLESSIQNKLLNYLTNDLYEDDHQCWHLVKQILLDKFSNEFKGCIKDQIIIITDQKLLNPGDGIVLFSQQSDSITLQHYAIFFDNDIYISKFGNGGYIFFSDLQSMMDVWKCDGFAKINLTIANIKTFSIDAFPTLKI